MVALPVGRLAGFVGFHVEVGTVLADNIFDVIESTRMYFHKLIHLVDLVMDHRPVLSFLDTELEFFRGDSKQIVSVLCHRKT